MGGSLGLTTRDLAEVRRLVLDLIKLLPACSGHTTHAIHSYPSSDGDGMSHEGG